MEVKFPLTTYVKELKEKYKHLEYQYKVAPDETTKESILEEMDSLKEEINILEDH